MAVLTINGKKHDAAVDPETPLLWVLRDTLGMTGTKFGCGIAQCGACTVHVDGAPARSCSLPVGSVPADAMITTIEGLAADGRPAPDTGIHPKTTRPACRIRRHTRYRHRHPREE